MSSRSSTITVNVSAQSAQLPTWLQGTVPWQVINIPGSGMLDASDAATGYAHSLAPSYLNNSLGANMPINQAITPTSPALHQDNPNKYGNFRSSSLSYGVLPSWYSEHYSFQGMAFDSGRYSGRPANTLTGCGDSHYQNNHVSRFVFGVNNPYWDPTAIYSTNLLNFKTSAKTRQANRDNCGWSLPADGSLLWRTRTGNSFYRLSDHTLWQWLNGGWLQCPKFSSADPSGIPVGPNGQIAQQSVSPWKYYVSNGTSWVDSTATNDTHELDCIVSASDDWREDRYYDGSLRGGHALDFIQCREKDDLYIRLGWFSAYPQDSGWGSDIGAGDLTTKRWIGYPQDTPTAPMFEDLRSMISNFGYEPGSPSDSNPTVKHPITEDIWRTVGSKIIVFRYLGYRQGGYELWLDGAASVSFYGVSGRFAVAYNHPTRPDFILGRNYYRGAYRWWWCNITGAKDGVNNAVHEITSFTPGSNLSVIRPTIAGQSLSQDGILWCPEINKFVYLTSVPGGETRAQWPLYTVELINDTTIDIQPRAMGGLPVYDMGGGYGVLNNWHYVPILPGGAKGFILRRSGDGFEDRSPMQFWRTA